MDGSWCKCSDFTLQGFTKLPECRFGPSPKFGKCSPTVFRWVRFCLCPFTLHVVWPPGARMFALWLSYHRPGPESRWERHCFILSFRLNYFCSSVLVRDSVVWPFHSFFFFLIESMCFSVLTLPFVASLYFVFLHWKFLLFKISFKHIHDDSLKHF